MERFRGDFADNGYEGASGDGGSANGMMRDGAGDEAINGPVVFSCAKCRTILGDTFAYVASIPERNLFALQTVPESVACGKTRQVADEGSVYYNLSCVECDAVVGRRYMTTSEELDAIRNAFALDISKVITYELGKCMGDRSSDEGRPPPEFYTSVAFHEDLTMVKSNVTAIAAKLQRLEQAMARLTSTSPRSAGSGSRKRSSQQGLNPEIYHVDPPKSILWRRRRKPEDAKKSKIEHELVVTSPLRTPSLPTWRIIIAMVGTAINTSYLIAGRMTIEVGGPAGALVAYVVAVLVMYLAITALMEVASRMPTDLPFYMFGARLLGRAIGAALAWCYWFLWIVIFVYELVVGGFIMQYWLPDIDRALWCLLMFITSVIIVTFDTKVYSVVECTLILVVVGAIVAAIILGSLVAAGRLGDHQYGFETWQTEEGPFNGGIMGVIGAMVFSNFAVQAGERSAVLALKSSSRNSRRVVPLALCGILALLLWTTTFVTGLILPSDDPWFEQEEQESADGSTLTYVFEKAGAKPAAHVLNAVLLVSALVDCCMALYISTTILQDLAERHLAPRILRTPEGGILSPYGMGVCCVLTLGLWALTYINIDSALLILAGVIGTSGLVTWGAVALMQCILRWSKKHKLSPEDEATVYKDALFPVSPLVCLGYVGFIIVGVIYISARFGFDVDMFLFVTIQIFILIALAIGAAIAQHFGYVLC
ncbi:hypothetical protein GGF46_004538 [Coemansia sp. RSA 552]|nr:hypothetical protein GGF46_004538 [Coemansia sp. RSA 552]